MNKKYKACLIAIFVCLTMAGIKYLFAQYSGSNALKADAIHSLFDMLTSTLVLLSLYLSSLSFKNKYIKHIPKIIQVLLVLLIIALTGNFILDVYNELKFYESYNRSPFIVIFVSLLSIIVSNLLYRYQRKVGKSEKSFAILADAFETWLDQISSIMVLLSTVGILIGLESENTFIGIILGIIVFAIIVWIIEIICEVSNVKMFDYKSKFHKVLEYLSFILNHAIKLYLKHKKNASYSALAICSLMLVIYGASGIYTLKPGEIAVIQYFGKHLEYQGNQTGLNYRLPKPFSTIKILNVGEIKRLQITPNFDRNLRFYITKDENLIDLSVIAQYRISNVRDYAFNAVENKRLLKDIIGSVLPETIGKYDIDDALVHKKRVILNVIKKRSQQIISTYKLGIQLFNIQFSHNYPPRAVIDAFNDVSSAREDKRTYVDNAYGFKNKVIPQARAEAFDSVAKARAYKEKVVYNSMGKQKRLEYLLDSYQKSPYAFRKNEHLKSLKIISKKVNTEVYDKSSSKSLKIRIYRAK